MRTIGSVRQRIQGACCLAIATAVLATGCEPESQPQTIHDCTAVFLDGQDGAVLGRTGVVIEVDPLDGDDPLTTCLKASGERPPRTMVVQCTCETR